MCKERILLVEDEPDILAVNRKHLAAQGYEVFCARTLAEARAVLWEHPLDLIVLDVLMPDGSGYDFCAEVRRTNTVRIIYLTCMDKDGDQLRGLSEGGDVYLTKPYSLDVLSGNVMSQLRRGGFTNAGRIEVPPLTVDLLSGKAALWGEDISLAPKELQLLACLAANLGHSFTPAELYETVWGKAADASALHNVYSRMTNLKKKLRLDDNSPFELRSARDRSSYKLLKVRYAAEA